VRCAVVGAPVGHSLSPVLHTAAYAELGLDWTYERHRVTEAELPGFLQRLDAGWRGLSLTMPLKRAVMPLLDRVSEGAGRAGAANTVVLEDGGRTGHNTDVPGASAALRERWAGPVGHAVVLGGGATAASVVLALSDLGCRRVTLLVRDPSRAAATLATVARHPSAPQVDVADLGAPPPGPADVLVSTVPAGAQTGVVTDLVTRVGAVFDVVYDPWPTPLASAATGAGTVLVAGLDLLVHQAALQVRLMTGREAPRMRMRVAGERALAARAGRSSTDSAEPPVREPGGG
jgi:shikimate dehydrogenase